jgi:hypothetical protein
MEGRHYTDGLPQSFALHRKYSPLVAAFVRVRGRQPYKHEAGDTWDAARVSDGVGRTESFPLTVSGFTGTHRSLFTDGTLWSPVVRTVRFADLRPTGKIKDPVLGVAEVGLEATVPTGLDDPALRLSVILPWETDEAAGTVRDVLREELTDGNGDLDEDLYGGLLDFAGAYLDDAAPRWDFSVEPGTLEVEPGSSARATISIATDKPGGVAFAVQAVDVEGERGERAVSDVLVIECDEDGMTTVLYADEP